MAKETEYIREDGKVFIFTEETSDEKIAKIKQVLEKSNLNDFEVLADTMSEIVHIVYGCREKETETENKEELPQWYIANAGLYFDLYETTEAYELGGVNKHWTDYTIEYDKWDEEAYYKDFNSWWSNLSFDEQKRIYNKIKK